MSSFFNALNSWNSFDFKSGLNNYSDNDITEILQKEQLTALDFLGLLSPAADSRLEDIATIANKLTVTEFGRTMLIYTPLYLSNYCNNNCLYCGFSIKNSISRSRMTEKQIADECDKIHSMGIRHILLLTGGDRINSSFEYIKMSVKIVSKYFDSISIEMYSMSITEYKTLKELGVNNITIYQETYNEKLYKNIHLSGEKSYYRFRLDAPERIAESGIKSINLGVLLGLDDPVIDFFKVALHCDFIFKNYPTIDVSISLPRIKDTLSSSYTPAFDIPDRLFTKFIMAFRIFLPKAGISLSTREEAGFRDNLIPLGITKMSAGSKTNVGGHSLDKGENQFEISDKRSINEIDSTLRNKGYQPVYKDWVLI